MYFLIFKLMFWQIFAPDAVWYPVGDEAYFLPVKLDQEKYIFEVKCDSDNPKNVYSWRMENNADMAINGGYFDADNNPVGFVKTKEKTWGDANDYPAVLTLHENKARDPGTGNDPDPFPATFSINDQIDILKVEDFDPEKSTAAISSFPLLIWDGENNFPRETGKKARRTILGIKEDEIYFFISTKGTETLYESGIALEKFGIEKALNLDGGPSTGFSSDEIDIPSAKVPCAVLAFER